MRTGFIGFALVLTLPVIAQTTDDLRAEQLRRINEYRMKDKVPALVRNAKLDAAAQKHAENMARQDKVSDSDKNGHILDGKGPDQRLHAEGYQTLQWAENVGLVFGMQSAQRSSERAIDQWVKSPGHYKNIMSDMFDETGIGIAQSQSGKWYFCQTFGKSSGQK